MAKKVKIGNKNLTIGSQVLSSKSVTGHAWQPDNE